MTAKELMSSGMELSGKSNVLRTRARGRGPPLTDTGRAPLSGNKKYGEYQGEKIFVFLYDGMVDNDK